MIKNPVNRNNIILKINGNKIKYADIWLQILLQLGAKSVNIKDLSDNELRNNLVVQIEHIWLKEVKADKSLVVESFHSINIILKSIFF